MQDMSFDKFETEFLNNSPPSFLSEEANWEIEDREMSFDSQMQSDENAEEHENSFSHQDDNLDILQINNNISLIDDERFDSLYFLQNSGEADAEQNNQKDGNINNGSYQEPNSDNSIKSNQEETKCSSKAISYLDEHISEKSQEEGKPNSSNYCFMSLLVSSSRSGLFYDAHLIVS